MSRFLTLAMVACMALLTACSQSPDALKKTLTEHPEILFEAIEKNSVKFSETIQKTMMEARRLAQEKQQQEKQKEMEDQIKNPKKVPVDGRVVRGTKDAPMVLVVYSDFQCPYCQRGYQTVEELRAKYKEKLRVYYKHLPLDFHPMAMPAAKRFEAIAMQDAEKAWKFHDEVFKNQGRMQEGEKFLDEMAKKIGANVTKMKKDMESEDVKKRIAADTSEAQGLGIRGTPGFLMNGVVVHGALPPQAFDEIVAKRATYN